MGNLNKVMLIGRLGQDPDVRYMPNGGAVVNLSIATTDNWKDRETDQARESTEWHRVVFFANQAETIGKFMKKGDPIYVEGSLRTRKYDKNGVDTYSTEIKGKFFQFLKSKGEGGGSAPRSQAPEDENQDQATPERKPEPSPQDDFDDDIPF